MFTRIVIFLVSILITSHSFADDEYQQLAQPAEDLIQRPEWNLTIFPDGRNLPDGEGDALQGKQIFALKCAACHGPEGIGGSADPLVGEVGSLQSEYPEKTVNSYWPYTTTLFDYIRRAMPLDAPFSLSASETYALCAYILSQDGIIAPENKMNKITLPKVKMPNRKGFISFYSAHHSK